MITQAIEMIRRDVYREGVLDGMEASLLIMQEAVEEDVDVKRTVQLALDEVRGKRQEERAKRGL